MPISDTTKLDWLFKKLADVRYTSSAKSYYEELREKPGGIAVNADRVWYPKVAIPGTPPGGDTDDIDVIADLVLTEDVTVSGQKAWKAESGGTPLDNWISPSYGVAYSVVIKDSGGTTVPLADPSVPYFDYKSGILTFENTPTFGTPPKLSGYRYIGPVGDYVSRSVSRTISANHTFTSYTDISQIGVPANPGAGTRRVFVNSGTGELSVRTSGGATVSLESGGGVTDHGALTGLSDDDHSQYALLAGRAGGQTLYGGTIPSQNLTFSSTASATKGKIIFGNDIAYDEGNNRFGIGTLTPQTNIAGSLHIETGATGGLPSATAYSLIVERSTAGEWPRVGIVGSTTGTPILYFGDTTAIEKVGIYYEPGITALRLFASGAAGYPYLNTNGFTLDGVTLHGDWGPGDSLTLSSTYNATKGLIYFGPNSAYQETGQRLGIGITSIPTLATGAVCIRSGGSSIGTPPSLTGLSLLVQNNPTENTAASLAICSGNAALALLYFGDTQQMNRAAVYYNNSGDAGLTFWLSGVTPQPQYSATGWNFSGATVYGTSAVGGTLKLRSTTDATKGKILLGTSETSAFDDVNNRLGILTASPVAPLSVGASSQFQVASDGDVQAIKGQTYDWPASSLVAGVLTNDGAGNLSWSAGGVSGLTPGGVLFGSAGGGLGQSATDFFWNDTANALALGTNSVTTNSTLDLFGSICFPTHTRGLAVSRTNVWITGPTAGEPNLRFLSPKGFQFFIDTNDVDIATELSVWRRSNSTSTAQRIFTVGYDASIKLGSTGISGYVGFVPDVFGVNSIELKKVGSDPSVGGGVDSNRLRIYDQRTPGGGAGLEVYNGYYVFNPASAVNAAPLDGISVSGMWSVNGTPGIFDINAYVGAMRFVIDAGNVKADTSFRWAAHGYGAFSEIYYPALGWYGRLLMTLTDKGHLSVSPNTSAGGIQLDPWSTSAGNTSELRFLELAANGTHYVGFKAADNITANQIWTLPAADGAANAGLVTNGAGVLSWRTQSQFARFTSTDVRTSTTTPANANDGTTTLQFAVNAGETWHFECLLNFTTPATGLNPGYQVQFTGPAVTAFAFTITAPEVAYSTSPTTFIGALSTSTGACYLLLTKNNGVVIRGYVVANGSGNITLQWAQGQSSVVSTTMGIGSSIWARRTV